MNEVSTIRDIRLAADGQRKIDWVKQYMPVLNSLRDQYIQERPFAGKKLSSAFIWKQKPHTWP